VLTDFVGEFFAIPRLPFAISVRLKPREERNRADERAFGIAGNPASLSGRRQSKFADQSFSFPDRRKRT